MPMEIQSSQQLNSPWPGQFEKNVQIDERFHRFKRVLDEQSPKSL
jgi:hypothetical protein